MDTINPQKPDYKEYVGPAAEYDVMGATQFRLLSTLGLRDNHYLLDVGCGSLRAGKLLLVYLNEAHYFGIEPNKWLIDDAIENEIGADQMRIKKPQFDDNANFDASVFDRKFDFILAQSIFSHTGAEIITPVLAKLKEVLTPDGIIAVTFVEGRKDFAGSGWVYPGSVAYSRRSIARFAKDAGLLAARIPWYHPRQRWYLLATDERRLPDWRMMRHLSGAILLDPEFVASWNIARRTGRLVKWYLIDKILRPITNRLLKR